MSIFANNLIIRFSGFARLKYGGAEFPFDPQRAYKIHERKQKLGRTEIFGRKLTNVYLFHKSGNIIVSLLSQRLCDELKRRLRRILNRLRCWEKRKETGPASFRFPQPRSLFTG